MGLDVYLYRITNKEDVDRREAEYHEYTESLWKDNEYDTVSESVKQNIRELSQAKALSLGLNEYGSDTVYKQKIELDSDLYPDHMFKIGYMRSSYNGGGINNVLNNLGLPDLYDIFGVDMETPECQPDYEQALVRVKEVIYELRQDEGYRVMSVAPNMFSKPNVPNQAIALEIFKEQLGEGGSRSYTNSHGDFYLDEPLEILAAIPGTQSIMGERPCTYLVYKTKHGNVHYIQSLEIVQEMLEFILAHENPQEFYMYWSG